VSWNKAGRESGVSVDQVTRRASHRDAHPVSACRHHQSDVFRHRQPGHLQRMHLVGERHPTDAAVVSLPWLFDQIFQGHRAPTCPPPIGSAPSLSTSSRPCHRRSNEAPAEARQHGRRKLEEYLTGGARSRRKSGRRAAPRPAVGRHDRSPSPPSWTGRHKRSSRRPHGAGASMRRHAGHLVHARQWRSSCFQSFSLAEHHRRPPRWPTRKMASRFRDSKSGRFEQFAYFCEKLTAIDEGERDARPTARLSLERDRNGNATTSSTSPSFFSVQRGQSQTGPPRGVQRRPQANLFIALLNAWGYGDDVRTAGKVPLAASCRPSDGHDSSMPGELPRASRRSWWLARVACGETTARQGRRRCGRWRRAAAQGAAERAR